MKELLISTAIVLGVALAVACDVPTEYNGELDTTFCVKRDSIDESADPDTVITLCVFPDSVVIGLPQG